MQLLRIVSFFCYVIDTDTGYKRGLAKHLMQGIQPFDVFQRGERRWGIGPFWVHSECDMANDLFHRDHLRIPIAQGFSQKQN